MHRLSLRDGVSDQRMGEVYRVVIDCIAKSLSYDENDKRFSDNYSRLTEREKGQVDLFIKGLLNERPEAKDA
jgi:FixJ family two-component response regulator